MLNMCVVLHHQQLAPIMNLIDVFIVSIYTLLNILCLKSNINSVI